MPVTVEIIGQWDYMGHKDVQFAKCDGIIYPLTPCCQASAKGCDGYVGCRKCYQPLDCGFGAAWDESQWEGHP